MPAPTTNPKPSPKAPPVCKKGPKKPAGTPLATDRRPLSATALCHLALTGVPAGINEAFTMLPLPTPGHWEGLQPAGDVLLETYVFKNPADDNYAIELYISQGGTDLASFQWLDQTPKKADPLEFADLNFKDPLTGNTAILTIIS